MARISFIFIALLAFLLQLRMSHYMLDFWATQNWLQFMVNLFAQENYSLGPSATPQQITAELQVIANHVKNCSDVFDSSIIAHRSYRKLMADDAATLNTCFISSTILGHLNTLLFKGVNRNPQMHIMLCHWVGDLVHENDIFFSAVSAASLTPDLSTAWTVLRTCAASGYGDFMGNLNGFRCGGL